MRSLSLRVSDKLKELRRRKGLNPSEVAKGIGCGYRGYIRWEEGISLPSLPNVIGIADFYGISLDELVGRCKKLDMG